jgi:putative membrane protein
MWFYSYTTRSLGDPAIGRSSIPELLIRWLILAFSVWVAAEVVSGIHLEGIWSILAVAAILGLLNLYLRPLLFMISIPLTLLTLGLFIVVINAVLLGLTDLLANVFDLRFAVEDVGAALLGAIVISLVNMMLTVFLRPGRF